MFVRRRPLARAAMIGGTAYVGAKAGQRSATRQQEEAQQEAEQNAQIQELQAQQAAAAAPAPAPAAGGTDLAGELTKLKGLLDQGILTQEEFDAAKQKLLAG
jgi:membrane protease subunit (stomatin/prohibitin family)